MQDLCLHPGHTKKTISSSVQVEHIQDCSLSPVLLVVLLDRISKLSCGDEGFYFGNLSVLALLFAVDVVPVYVLGS